MAHPHGISGLAGKFVAESQVNCNADKFYEIFKYCKDVPRVIPHIYTYVKVVEGDGLISGCVKEWGYNLEGRTLTVKETSTYTDEKRMIHHNAIGGDMMNDYKKFYLILVVTPKSDGHGSIVQWTIEYEKKNVDSPDPIPYLALCTQITEGLNAHLCAYD
ncbi:hypothetical protein MKW94_005537 [Papaver nudicaule]|uniref:Bet v I/Major latex protein domain-containing protein n=1 Tax=Papaver nudicaule TaxID=74823 RepID=A0AA41VLA7_PAPNU|nr:hypothetical protein [Papaver nudicaule]